MDIKTFLFSLISLLLAGACTSKQDAPKHAHKATVDITTSLATQLQDTMARSEITKIHKTEEEWKKILSSGEYRILRGRGTELPFVNEYYDNEKEGIYYCRACGQPLYSSETKYKSRTGWPSFWEPIKPSLVDEKEDNSFFMTRTEIVCSRCGSHLGHVFSDGPEPTGLRYCMNSKALTFKEMDLSNVEVEELGIINVE
jgi:peptide-methionine (R)-S-oxide reductase